MAQLTYPGVYIEEFAPGAPIQGVGTSTAAFIGAGRRRADLTEPDEAHELGRSSRQTFGDPRRAGLLPLVRGARVLRERRAGLLRRARQQRRTTRTSSCSTTGAKPCRRSTDARARRRDAVAGTLQGRRRRRRPRSPPPRSVQTSTATIAERERHRIDRHRCERRRARRSSGPATCLTVGRHRRTPTRRSSARVGRARRSASPRRSAAPTTGGVRVRLADIASADTTALPARTPAATSSSPGSVLTITAGAAATTDIRIVERVDAEQLPRRPDRRYRVDAPRQPARVGFHARRGATRRLGRVQR